MNFLLTNRLGGFAMIAKRAQSRFHGIFYKNEDRVIKILEDIRIKGKEPSDVHFHIWKGERRYQDNKETFFMPLHKNSILYELASPEVIELVVDVKESYDDREWGRNYLVYEDEGFTVIRFTKKTDRREDPSEGKHEYDSYIVFRKETSSFVDRWERSSYELDRRRGSGKGERYVYIPLEIRTKSLLISFGPDLKKAKEENILLHSTFEKTKKQSFDHALKLTQKSVTVDEEGNVAYNCSVNALDSLMVNEKGSLNMYAGLPWFFQYWSRDEMISVGALIKIGRYAEAGAIIEKYINNIGEDGRIPNRLPHSDLASADGIGWMIYRFGELLMELEVRDILNQYYPSGRLSNLINKIEIGVNKLIKSHTRGEFAINGPNQTWMDTSWEGDERGGIRIEIQALFLSIYNFMYRYTNNYKYKRLEEELKESVRTKMIKDGVLADGLDDWTARPNVFIAAYVYPDLMSKTEWKICLNSALDKLWLSWGGLSTIDKDHRLFTPRYTGENNRSYHRGDSWFYINCMAAVAMKRIDGFEFMGYIDRIAAACKKEILHQGTIGYAAEVSSAEEMTSEGCTAQLWSSAMFIELMLEIRNTRIIQI